MNNAENDGRHQEAEYLKQMHLFVSLLENPIAVSEVLHLRDMARQHGQSLIEYMKAVIEIDGVAERNAYSAIRKLEHGE